MDEETFISFEDFRSKKYKKVNIKNNMSKDEILEKADEIRKLHQGTHQGIAKLPSPES